MVMRYEPSGAYLRTHDEAAKDPKTVRLHPSDMRDIAKLIAHELAAAIKKG